MTKIRISTISYTNTKPFVYGMQHYPELLEHAELIFDSPSECARKLICDEADLGIVPVAALPDIPFYRIVSDYCIAADGPVNSVFLFSNKPIEEIRVIRRDPQSRSSNNLARILTGYFWKTAARFIDSDSKEEADALVLIGDRTFKGREAYAYQYDLAGEWKNFTGLPFVFAVWAANKELGSEFIEVFNKAMQYGTDHRPQLLKELDVIPGFDLSHYMMLNLQYKLDEKKRAGLALYLEYLTKIDEAESKGHNGPEPVSSKPLI